MNGPAHVVSISVIPTSQSFPSNPRPTQSSSSSSSTTTTITTTSPFPSSNDISFRLHRAAYLHVVNVSDCDGQEAWYPDPLIPEQDDFVLEKRNALPFFVQTGHTQAYWVDVFVRPSVTAGRYVFTVVVETQTRTPAFIDPSISSDLSHISSHSSASSSSTATVTALSTMNSSMTLSITVFNFTLPSNTGPSYVTAFGVSSVGILKGFYGPSWQKYVNISVHVTQQYADMALAHRITLSNMMASDWSALAAAHVDWPGFYKRWESFIQGHDLPWGLRNASASVFEIPPVAFDPSRPNATRTITYWREFANLAQKYNFLSRTFDYTCDEPHDSTSFQACMARGRAVKTADKGIPVLITTEWPAAVEFGVVDLIDNMVPIINFVENAKNKCASFPTWTFGNHRPDYDSFVEEADKRLWWYQSCLSHGCTGGCSSATQVCNSGWPSYMLDSPAIMGRVMPWLSYLYDMGGELYWGVNYQDTLGLDSWQSIWEFGGNGDGTLTYPGTPCHIGGTTPVPIASMRLKYIRDGLEDLMYMQAAEKRRGRDTVLDIIRQVVQNTYTYTRDNFLLLNIRDLLAAAAEEY